ncbi:MAG: ATPase [Bacteroidota bacterium]
MQLIADSGSTKTNWVLLNKNEVIKACTTRGFNPHYLSEVDIISGLRSELVPCLDKWVTAISKIWFYGAGCSGKIVNEKVQDALGVVFQDSEAEVNSDLLAAARSLCGNQPGIACILGTGSNSCQYDGLEIKEHIPPLGFLFGDDGSGAELGRLLVKAYFQKDLSAGVAEKFELAFGSDRTAILEKVYSSSTPNRELAGFAPFVVANLDHAEIYGLAKRTFRQFFENAVLKYTDHQKCPIHFTGSIAFHFQPLLNQFMKSYHLNKGVVTKGPMDRLIHFHMEA